jgi:hypothetical protein
MLSAMSVLFASRPAAAADDDLKPEEVRTAILKGRTWMLSQQEDDGSFQHKGGHDIGKTSLAILALINSGMPPTEPEIKKGLKFLRAARLPSGTYEISLMLMALAAAKDKARDALRIAALVELLEAGQATGGGGAEGGWTYTCPRGGGFGIHDRSNSQFAVLALRDAVYAGAKVKKSTWLRVKKYWEEGQNADGGWGYIREGTRGSMTVAGIASLVIVSRVLDKDQNRKDGDKPNCCVEQKPNRRLDRAIAKLASVFNGRKTSVGNFPRGSSSLLYYLYGLERAGRLSGRRFFGKHDWYREGARFLVKYQQRTGKWVGSGLGEDDPLVSTSMALLFLSKGLAPVLINKLNYAADPAKDIDWNRHGDDARNLTEYIITRDKWPQLLTFQTVEMQKMLKQGAAEAEEALDQSKVLLITGRESPDELINDPKQYGYLKDYVKRGGFIFAVGNCSREGGFDKGFRTLVEKMFTDPNTGKREQGMELKRLQKDHPIYRSEHRLIDAWKDIELWGVDFGCRTAIVYAPVGKDAVAGFDLSCGWNDWRLSPTKRRHEWVSRAMRIGENVLAYATGREPPQKLRELDKSAGKGKNPIERGFLQVAKLKHTGDWDVAPRALRNLLLGLNRANGMTASTKQWDISPADKNLFRYPVVYMHGRNGFSMSATSKKQLKEYLSNRGGLLFADACCGSPSFDKSFRALMTDLFGRGAFKRIPVTHEIFTRKIGYDITKVKRRMPESASTTAKITASTKEVEPFLEGIEVEGRLVVIYSKLDISCALERQASIACAGYVEQDAMKIGINVMLYALMQDVRYSQLFE